MLNVSNFYLYYYLKYSYYSIYLIDHDFMAQPQSGIKESNILLRLVSSTGSSFPSFLILSNKLVCVDLKCEMNLDSNFEI
jgi:hypothetical protein